MQPPLIHAEFAHLALPTRTGIHLNRSPGTECSVSNTVIVQLEGIMIRVRVSKTNPSAVFCILFALFFKFLTIKSHELLSFVCF